MKPCRRATDGSTDQPVHHQLPHAHLLDEQRPRSFSPGLTEIKNYDTAISGSNSGTPYGYYCAYSWYWNTYKSSCNANIDMPDDFDFSTSAPSTRAPTRTTASVGPSGLHVLHRQRSHEPRARCLHVEQQLPIHALLGQLGVAPRHDCAGGATAPPTTATTTRRSTAASATAPCPTTARVRTLTPTSPRTPVGHRRQPDPHQQQRLPVRFRRPDDSARRCGSGGQREGISFDGTCDEMKIGGNEANPVTFEQAGADWKGWRSPRVHHRYR